MQAPKGTPKFYKSDRLLADGWFVFAVAVHSYVFFFDMDKKDGQVYHYLGEIQKIGK